jgi:hypothetical protein
MIGRALVIGIAAAVMAGVMVTPAFGQTTPSRCGDCHLARPDAPGERHVSDWERSPHGRNSVGCESCHRGNPTTFEPFQAHQGILHFSNPASPVARINLPGTCGTCHKGPLAAFQKSRHYELVRSGNRDAPTCVTCHDEVAAYLLSPRQLESRCASCHGTGKVAPNTDFPAEGRLMLEGVRDARALLKEANAFIARITDRDRRARLEAAARDAAIPLTEATDAGHAFVFKGLKERLDVARTRIAALYAQLANPAPR